MWSSRRWRPAAAGMLLLLAGCGFRPLYGTAGDGEAAEPELQSVVLGPATNRIGQLVRNNLLDRLTPQGAPASPRYLLDVAISEDREEQAITRSDEATRTSLTVRARYVLRDWRSNVQVHAASTRAETAYNVLRADFGNVIAETDARSRLARQVAENIRLELAAWFARAPDRP